MYVLFVEVSRGPAVVLHVSVKLTQSLTIGYMFIRTLIRIILVVIRLNKQAYIGGAVFTPECCLCSLCSRLGLAIVP